jgi:PAS domain S-box-containing protein
VSRVSEVSCRASALILEGLRSRKIPEAELVSGLPVTVAELRDTRKRIPWDVFVELLERTEALCGEPEALEEIAASVFDSPTFEYLRRIARLFVDSRDVFWMGSKWFGHSIFWSVDDRFETLPDGRLRETVTLRPGYRDSPAFFRLLLGAIRSAPRFVGQPDAVVTMELTPRQAVYEIEPPPARSWWARLPRRLANLVASRGAIEELRVEQEELKAGFRKLQEAHAELRRCEEEQRAILSSLDRTLVALLDRDGRILSMFGSDEVASRYGLPNGPIEGYRLADLLPPESAALALALVRSSFDTGEVRRGEHDLRLPAGEFHFDVCFSPIAAASGGIRAVLAAIRDISERKELQLALEQADRLAAVGTLAAGIAHELNNPLSAIRLSAEHALALEAQPEATLDRKDCLGDILSNTERCSHIVKGVLRFARRESSEKEPCDLNAVVRSARDLTSRYLEARHATVTLDLGRNLPPIHANAVEIEQVAVNLLRNAVEAGREKVHVLVRTERLEGRLRLAVVDDGPGLGDYEMQHVFDPFYTTRQSNGGTGLGLSVVHGIVRDHGGTIGIRRGSGGGTEIAIELPTVASGREGRQH